MNPVSLSKKYKCKVCKTAYTKRNPWQSVCGDVSCAVTVATKSKAKRERLDRAEKKKKLAALARKPELVAKAQKAFNAYIRARDYGQPCICCGKPIAWGTASTGGVCDAGHYLSVGSRVNLRFNEANVHAQLKECNKYKSGNAANYRIGLIKRIGLAHVEVLERDHVERKYTKEALIAMAQDYKARARELNRRIDLLSFNVKDLSECLGITESV